LTAAVVFCVVPGVFAGLDAGVFFAPVVVLPLARFAKCFDMSFSVVTNFCSVCGVRIVPHFNNKIIYINIKFIKKMRH